MWLCISFTCVIKECSSVPAGVTSNSCFRSCKAIGGAIGTDSSGAIPDKALEAGCACKATDSSGAIPDKALEAGCACKARDAGGADNTCESVGASTTCTSFEAASGTGTSVGDGRSREPEQGPGAEPEIEREDECEPHGGDGKRASVGDGRSREREHARESKEDERSIDPLKEV